MAPHDRQPHPGTRVAAAVRRRLLAAALLLFTAAGQGAAAPPPPLISVLPADTLFVVHYGAGGAPHATLVADLEALDAAGKLRAVLGPMRSTLGDEGARALEALDAWAEGRALPVNDSLAQRCPALARDPGVLPRPEELLAGVSLRPMAPRPAATVLLRATDAEAAAALDAALRDCFGQGTPQRQDDVALHPLRLGDGPPWTLGRSDALLVLASDPEGARGVVRRLKGSAEPALGDTALGTSPALRGDGVGFALHLAAVADLLDAVPGVDRHSPTGHALDRVRAALRTVNVLAGAVRSTSEGLEVQLWTHIDDAGGDPELAALLRCVGCRARPSVLLPRGAWSVGSAPLRLRGWSRYLLDLAGDLQAATGTPVDPRPALRDALGVDLDRDLFAWLGDRIHEATLPPERSNLAGIAGAPAQLTLVPVSSETEAWAGLERIAAALAPRLASLPEELGGRDASGVAAVAVRRGDYRGVRVARLQLGPATDLGVAVVGNHLVLAQPAAAVRPVIDTFFGGPSIYDNRALQSALQALPERAQAVSAGDEAPVLRALASTAEALAQPLSFAAYTALAREGDGTPPLAALLDAAELPASVLRVLADHLGVASGAAVELPEGVVWSLRVPIR